MITSPAIKITSKKCGADHLLDHRYFLIDSFWYAEGTVPMPDNSTRPGYGGTWRWDDEVARVRIAFNNPCSRQPLPSHSRKCPSFFFSHAFLHNIAAGKGYVSRWARASQQGARSTFDHAHGDVGRIWLQKRPPTVCNFFLVGRSTRIASDPWHRGRWYFLGRTFWAHGRCWAKSL